MDHTLESFIVTQGVVLRDSLNKWRSASSSSLLEVLIHNAASIRNPTWSEVFGREPGYPQFWADGRPQYLPADAFRDPFVNLLAKGWVLLQDGLAPLIGIIDPADVGAAMSEVIPLFPAGTPTEVRLVSPHFIANCRSFIKSGAINDKYSISSEDKKWLEGLGLPFPDGASWNEISTFFRMSYKLDFIQPGFFKSALPIRGVANTGIIFKTNTLAWVVGTDLHKDRERQACLQATGLKIIPFIVTPCELERLLSNSIEANKSSTSISNRVQSWDVNQSLPPEEIGYQLYNKILTAAVKIGASDVHIEPEEERYRIRFRLNGDLYEQPPISPDEFRSLSRRCKVSGSMDQTEDGKIQDGSGSFTTSDEKKVELRFNVTIAKGGKESFCIRILTDILPSLHQLDMSPEARRALEWYLGLESGLFIICGIVGSGKSTTTYAALREVTTSKRKTITIENPVEKILPGAVQIEIRDNGKVSWNDALKSALRQDINNLMIGEIRDVETAAISVNAALSGHKVFSTTHSDDPIGVYERFITSFCVDKASFAKSARLIMSQRLVGKLCPLCAEYKEPPTSKLRLLPDVSSSIAKPVVGKRVGCPACKNGLVGRFAIAELFIVDDSMQAAILKGESGSELRKRNRDRGFESLADQATKLALTGVIELDEAQRFLSDAPF